VSWVISTRNNEPPGTGTRTGRDGGLYNLEVIQVKNCKVYGQVLALSDQAKERWEWFRVDRFPAPLTLIAAAQGDPSWLDFLRNEIVSKLLAKSKLFANPEEVILYFRPSVYRKLSSFDKGDALTALVFDYDDRDFHKLLDWFAWEDLTLIPTNRGYHVLVVTTRGIDPRITEVLKTQFEKAFDDLGDDVNSILKPKQLFRFPYRVERLATKAVRVARREGAVVSCFWGENWKTKELKDVGWTVDALLGGLSVEVAPYGDLREKVEETVKKMEVRHYRGDGEERKKAIAVSKVKKQPISTELNFKEVVPLLLKVRGLEQTALLATLIMEGKVTARTAGAILPLNSAITLVWEFLEKTEVASEEAFKSLSKLRRFLEAGKTVKGPGDRRTPSWRATPLGLEYYGQRVRGLWGPYNLKTGLPAVISWLRVDANVDLGRFYGNLNELALKLLDWEKAIVLAKLLFETYLVDQRAGPIKALKSLKYDETKARRVANVLKQSKRKAEVSLKLLRRFLKWLNKRLRRWSGVAKALIRSLAKKFEEFVVEKRRKVILQVFKEGKPVNFAFVKLQE